MEQTFQASQPHFDQAGSDSVVTPQGRGLWREKLRAKFSNRNAVKSTLLTTAALAIMALPVGVALSSKQTQGFQFSFSNFLSAATATNESAVLAVDASGMTIRGRNITAAAQERFETAAVDQLAGLHQLYAGWTSPHQEAIGSMLLKLIVDGTGKVARIESVRAQLSSSDFTRVVLSEMRQWNFPAGAIDPVEITIPLLFVPKGMDPSTVVQWERRTRVVDGKEKAASVTQIARATPAVSVSAKLSLAEPAPVLAKAPQVFQDVVTHAKVQPSPARTLPVFKTTQAVTLRQQPRFAAERVHEIDAETELNLLENKGAWLKVKVADASAIGFVRKEYITPVN